MLFFGGFMKKVLVAVLLTAMIIGNAAALEVDFYDLPAAWAADFATIEDQLREKIDEKYGKYEEGEKLNKGIGNANALAADGGYMRTANGYDWINVAVSINSGVAMDGGSIWKFNDDFIDKFEDKGDLYMGAGLQLITASIGFNLGHLLKWDHGLYITLKGGVGKIESGDLDFDSYNLGFMVNYQLLEAKNLGNGKILKWRGLNVGTGLNYYSSTLKWTINHLEPVDVNQGGEKFTYDTDLDVKSEISRFIIPVEINTGIKLTVLELFGGLGADFMFGGDNEVSVNSVAEVTRTNSDEVGHAKMKMSKDGDLDTVKFRYTVGLGFSLGPVRLEIPYTQYFGEDFTGSIGVIGGVAF